MPEKIATVPDYLDYLKRYDRQTVIFRGTDHEWKMLPTITRSFSHHLVVVENGTPDPEAAEDKCREWHKTGIPRELRGRLESFETTIFDSFRRQARPHLKSYPNNPWEWLAVAQHSGLPTRLLDWTKNPLAAAYFALAGSPGDPDADVYVFAMDFGPLAKGNTAMIDLDAPPKNSPLDYQDEDGFDRFIPPVIDPRIAAQQAVFTVQHPMVSITVRAKTQISRLVFDGKKRHAMRSQLQRLGVNQATLFPDMENLCRSLRWVWEQYRIP